MGNDRFFNAAEPGQCTGHQLLGDTDAKTAGNQFVPDKTLGIVHLLPGLENFFPLGCLIFISQGQQRPLNPVMQGAAARSGAAGQNECDGFRQVPDHIIGNIKQPIRNFTDLGSPLLEFAGRDDLARLSSDQKTDGPDRIFGRCRLKVINQRRDLCVGFGGFIKRSKQVGKKLHSCTVRVSGYRLRIKAHSVPADSS